MTTSMPAAPPAGNAPARRSRRRVAVGLLVVAGVLAVVWAVRPPRKPLTPADNVKAAPGFAVELVYAVPKKSQGSWVSLCHDPDGRLYAGDQTGALYRVTPPGILGATEPVVEPVPAKIGMAQGLVWANGALYAMVNDTVATSGLYRVTATTPGGLPDTAERLLPLTCGTEHGCHAVILQPGGKRLTLVCGNQTFLPPYDRTRVPPVWGEDHLLPRLPDGNGFMAGVLAPGGFVLTCDLDGRDVEVLATGLRNPYDAAYNREGELFTYDADMEWDFNTPWYRPTRVCHVTSGGEWGWRNGAGKYPTHYPDTLPPVVDIGPGSPTGVCFGYGAKFPPKYQSSLFLCDWSYGKLYAVHLQPKGATYAAAAIEEFVTGTPLPLTDLVVNPVDGALYFTVGGRQTQSGLYRVTYTGTEPTTPLPERGEELAIRGPKSFRKLLEQHHGRTDPAVSQAWPQLGHPDRFVRFAARTALEHQPPSAWLDRALTETDPAAAITALLAAVRVSAPCPEHSKQPPTPAARALGTQILAALARLDRGKLTTEQRLELARVYQVTLHRLGLPTAAERDAVLARLDPLVPTGDRFLDGLLLETLVALQSPSAAPKGMKLLAGAPTQEEQLEYVRSLRMLTAGWTPELRAGYFKWFLTAAGYKGGASFAKFLALIKADAVARLSEPEKAALKPILNAVPVKTATATPPRAFVRKWTLAELEAEVAPLLAKGRDFDRGRRLFAAASCFGCHRYDNEGGSTGPDLSGVAGRFSPRDLLESIVDPSKEVSDQYQATEIETVDGRQLVGRVISSMDKTVSVMTDLLDPAGVVEVRRSHIERTAPSRVSLMPAGLLDTLAADEVADLLAFLLCRGDRSSPMFR